MKDSFQVAIKKKNCFKLFFVFYLKNFWSKYYFAVEVLCSLPIQMRFKKLLCNEIDSMLTLQKPNQNKK